MHRKIFLFVLSCLFIAASAPASYYYLKFGALVPPVDPNGSLPLLGFGGRLKGGFIDLDLSISGAAKKKSSYVTAKGLLLCFAGRQFYVGAGLGMGYAAKTPIVKLLKGGPKTTLVNFESVIGYENCGKFIQLEMTKPIRCSHGGDYKTGFALTLGSMF